MAVQVGTLTFRPAYVAESGAPPWRRVRPLWLVGALSVATLNLYALYWIWATWRELKAEWADASMRPGWHAASILGPVHGVFQYYRHMQAILELARANGVATSFSPLACVLLWLATTLAGFAVPLLALQGAAVPPYGALLIVLSQAPLVLWAQSTLNHVWLTLPGGAPAYRASPWAWPTIAIGTLFQLLPLLGLAAP